MEFTDPITQINDITIEKYKMASKILTKVLDYVVNNSKENNNIYDICKEGDKLIEEELSKVYKNNKNKGTSFPTSITKNNKAGNYNPIEREIEENKLKEGDLIKIEMGVHIDGYPIQVVYSMIVGDKKIGKEDKRNKVLRAVGEASQEILKVMKPNKTNKDVVKILEKYSEKYGCNLPTVNELDEYKIIPGIMSYQTSRNIIDGFNDDQSENIHRVILSKQSDNYSFSLRETEFEENEVYTIDVLMSSGTGKLTESKYMTTIYKRRIEDFCNLKLNSSKDTLNKFGKDRFPITTREHNNPKFKLGLKECMSKGLIDSYPVYQDNESEYIARVKFTVIIKNNPILLSGRSIDDQLAKLD